jgi:hypothetical protein
MRVDDVTGNFGEAVASGGVTGYGTKVAELLGLQPLVGQCRLTLSNPR